MGIIKSTLVKLAIQYKLSRCNITNVIISYRIVVGREPDDFISIENHDKNKVRLEFIQVLSKTAFKDILEIMETLSLEEAIEIARANNYEINYYTPEY